MTSIKHIKSIKHNVTSTSTITDSLKIRKISINDIKPRKNILIIGKQGSGKTTLINDILYHIRKKVNTAFAISPASDSQQMFRSCLPESHVYSDYSPEIIQNLISTMTNLKNHSETKNIDVGLIADNSMHQKEIWNSKEMREICMNGRHYNLWFITSVQNLVDIGPDVQSQIDYVFVFKNNTISNRQKLYKYFFGLFEKFEDFCTVLDNCTNNYECLVLDNTKISGNIEDSLYYYKANLDIQNFKVGNKNFSLPFQNKKNHIKSTDNKKEYKSNIRNPSDVSDVDSANNIYNENIIKPLKNILKINKFSMDNIKPRRNILIIGRRGTGKTTLINDILYHIQKKLDTAYAICHDNREIFESHLPKSNVYNNYSPEFIQELMQELINLKEQKENKNIGLIFDDCMYEKGIMKTKELREIHLNGIDCGLWFINSFQYLMDIEPDIRSTIDYVFIFRDKTLSSRQKLHQNFFNIFKNFDDFCTVFDSLDTYECLVLDNTQNSNNI